MRVKKNAVDDEILPGAPEAEPLHPNVVQARLVLAAAKATYAQACRSIDGQYLKSLDGLDPVRAAQADAVRAEF